MYIYIYMSVCICVYICVCILICIDYEGNWERSSLTHIELKQWEKILSLLDQLQASKQPWKGSFPPRQNEAIFRIFCFGSLRFVLNLAFVCYQQQWNFGCSTSFFEGRSNPRTVVDSHQRLHHGSWSPHYTLFPILFLFNIKTTLKCACSWPRRGSLLPLLVGT